MRFGLLGTLLALCLSLAATVPLRGQIAYTTIELLTEEAKSVYVGKVIAIDRPPGVSSDSQQRTVVIEVAQTLKGTATERFSFNDPDTRLTAWEKSGASLMFFFGRGGGTVAPMRIIDLADIGVAGISENLVVLNKPEQLIQAVQTAALRTPQPSAQEMMLSLPPSIATGPGWPQVEPVVFPVDIHLEQLAYSILRKEPGDSYRAEAVEALSFFKSDENIRLLRSLLSRPSDGKTCAAASRVLTDWGISGP